MKMDYVGVPVRDGVVSFGENIVKSAFIVRERMPELIQWYPENGDLLRRVYRQGVRDLAQVRRFEKEVAEKGRIQSQPYTRLVELAKRYSVPVVEILASHRLFTSMANTNSYRLDRQVTLVTDEVRAYMLSPIGMGVYGIFADLYRHHRNSGFFHLISEMAQKFAQFSTWVQTKWERAKTYIFDQENQSLLRRAQEFAIEKVGQFRKEVSITTESGSVVKLPAIYSGIMEAAKAGKPGPDLRAIAQSIVNSGQNLITGGERKSLATNLLSDWPAYDTRPWSKCNSGYNPIVAKRLWADHPEYTYNNCPYAIIYDHIQEILTEQGQL
jgi:hypothetical protein